MIERKRSASLIGAGSVQVIMISTRDRRSAGLRDSCSQIFGTAAMFARIPKLISCILGVGLDSIRIDSMIEMISRLNIRSQTEALIEISHSRQNASVLSSSQTSSESSCVSSGEDFMRVMFGT